jgi:glucose/arabinose dehydrogenase
MRRSLVTGMVGTLIVTACTRSKPAVTPTTPPKTTATTTTAPATTSTATTPTTSASATSTPLPSGTPGSPTDVVTGLSVPWSVAVLPDGSALISLRDRAQIVRVRANGSTVPLMATGPDGTVAGVEPSGEGGLLGLAISPHFATDGLVYAYATMASGNEVVRMRLTGNRLGAPRSILRGIASGPIHNGGRIKFGPDGMLYVPTGDANARPSSQERNSLNGKILRITPDGKPAPGNPFPNSPVWSLGHRNVQGLGWSADGTMYASEFGQNRFDELNKIVPGGNYGWPEVEGIAHDKRFIDPLAAWPTNVASPSGIVVTADAVYLAALRGQRLWRVPLTATGIGTPRSLLRNTLGRLRDVTLAPNGGLWLLTSNTFRGNPRSGDDRLVHLPLR